MTKDSVQIHVELGLLLRPLRARGSSVILALEKALRVSLIGEDHYRVVLTPDDAKTLASRCGELAEVSNPRDGAVLRLVAAVIDVAP